MKTRIKITNPNDIKIGKTYVLETDKDNAYFGLTDKEKRIEELKTKNLGIIITTMNQNNAAKGDEFIILGLFYADGKSIETKEKTDLGPKTASIIEFTEGKYKGKTAILMHHEDIGDSIKIMKELYQLN